MSEALPYIGAAVGSFIPGVGTQAGWLIGSALSLAFAPTQKSQGPRLQDLTVTGMAYGQPIPYIQGTHRTAGQLIWSTDRREIPTRVKQGKGGGKSSTTYTYEVDCMFLLSSNQLDGLLRVWNNGKLVYSADDNATDESLIASMDTDLWRRITFYGGDAAQMPDPVYEAAVGAGNAPAYRGMCTIFIEGLQLGQSGQMLNLTFEVGTNLTPSSMQNFQDFSGNNVPVTLGTAFPSLNNFAGTTDTVAKFGASGHFLGGNIITPGYGLAMYENDRYSRLLPIDWTIKCWLYDDMPDGSSHAVCSFGIADGGVEGLYIFRDGSGRMTANYTATLSFNFNSIVDSPKNEWFYFELSKVGTTVHMFINGVLVNTVTGFNPDGLPLNTVPSVWALGGRYGIMPTWGGYIDDFVFEKVGGHTAGYAVPLEPHVPGFNTEIYIPFYYADTVQRGYEAIRTVVERLCARAGMPAGTYDASALDAITKPVRALAVSQVGGTRTVLDMLSKTFFFQAICTDKAYFVPRAQSVVATIPFKELGTAQYGAGNPEPLELKQRNDLEVPAQEALTYANVSDDYQMDTQYSDRILSAQTSTGSAEVPLGFTPSEAKAIADAKVTDGVIAMWGAPLSVSRKHSKLTPGDSILVEAEDGSEYRMLLGKLTQSNGVMGFEARLEEPTVFTQAGVTGGDYSPQTDVVAIAGTFLFILDIPQLRDADEGVGVYVAARGSTGNWPGAEVFESTDNLEFASRAVVTESAVMGVAITALGAWALNNMFDESSFVTVNVGAGELSSATRDDILGSTTLNVALIGNEIVQFRNASMVSPGIYLLSGFLRGRRGTDRVMTGHVAGERFVLLQTLGMRRIQQSTSDLAALRYFRGISLGRSLSTGATLEETNTGVSMKPFAPVNARANRATTDTSLTWDRRTRSESRFLGPLSSSVPLGEQFEAYEVEVYTSSAFATVARTLTSSTPSATYTSAQQVTDFGSNQTVLYVRIYQLSETVGRGFPLQATI